MGYEFIFYTGNELLDCCFEEDTSYEILAGLNMAGLNMQIWYEGEQRAKLILQVAV